ncbi:putative Ig domain-containing protein [Microtetraspora sp. AC03309]|uniref:putative Ig domain-containing protein n=1 Tax=Microtetraspora sp. AC03309 TaxID=2779376 RepID=UPI001E2DBE9D|nr:putative Ig domain-containing protein [Microtetraspora sp. AC03309]MCC5581269.1 putative Ig domain-containing protein [Microtetraspora sp. AC03309]
MRGNTTTRRLGRGVVTSIVIASTLGLGVAPVLAADGDQADTVVLTEDFSSGELPVGWTSHLGSWQVKDGRLEGTSVNGQRARVTFGTSYENYRLEATANFLQVANDSRWLNLAADFHGAEDYGSVFVVRSNTKLSNGLEYAVNKTAGGSYTSPVTAAANVALNTNETHALSLDVRGTRATLSIDGVAYLSTNDLLRTNGTLGLVVNNATVAFDDVKVTRLAAEATAPGAPTGLRVSQKDGQATLAWSEPADAGTTPGGGAATVTGYEVAIGAADAGADGLTWSPATGTSHTFTGLAPGAYALWVRAVNSEGRKGEPASAKASPGVPKIKGFTKTLSGGAWSAGHVQGIAVDEANGYIYYSFTTLLVKTDLEGNVIGTMGGFTGHLGDLDFNTADGRVYGSLEYKAQKAFYIAIIDVDAIDEIGMRAQNSDIMRTVYLDEVVADFTADMDGNGVFDGDTANTPDHRYGSSGIDGVSFGPKFGETEGEQYLTVAYGIYSNLTRTDNDHQVLLQYDIRDWARYEKPLVEAAPHHSGPESVSGKYFVRTGNTTYGVQNLEYDGFLRRWFMGVYAGAKPAFPNYTLFAVDAATRPVLGELAGTGGDRGLLITPAADGRVHEATGVRGWVQKADVGMESLGDGLFYLARNGTRNGQQTADITLYRWTGDNDTPFASVNDESELHRAPVITSRVPAGGEVGEVYAHTFTASAFPKARFEVTAGTLPKGLTLDSVSGVLSGTSTKPGRVAFTVTAANGVDPAATQRVIIKIKNGKSGNGKGNGSADAR